jgi:hypothetical protein
MQIEIALLTFLSAQTSLMGLVQNRITYVQANASWTGASPYLVFQKVSSIRESTHDGSTHLAHSRFQFSIFAAKYGDIKPVAAALQAILEGYAGLMGSVNIQACFYENEVDLDPGDMGLYGVACDYIIWHEE